MSLLSLGVYIAVCIGLGVGLGYLADEKLGTTPGLTFGGLALGTVVAGLGAYREIRKYV
jgi:F0F1-type ATP synthase assembly protein I